MARADTEHFDPKSPPGSTPGPKAPPPPRREDNPRPPPRSQPRGHRGGGAGLHARGSKLPEISRLLIVAAWMRSNLETTTDEEAASFRRRLRSDLENLRDNLASADINAADAELCSYMIACAVDNAALNSSFRAAWAGNQLAGEIFGQAHGGEEFFQRVKQLVNASPDSHPVIVYEVALLCLVCGFEGMLANHDNRERSLAELKRNLLQIIEEMRSTKHLETHRGEVAERPYVPAKAFPIWVTALVVFALLLGSLAFFQVLLGHRAQEALERMSLLAENVPIYAPPPPESSVSPPPPLPVVQETWPEELRQLCEVRNLECVITDSTATIILSGPEAFASASADLKPAYLERMSGLAAILDKSTGNIQVNGHSDPKPIRTFRYQNNTELSRDRADSASKILATGLKEPSRLFVKGYGETSLRCTETTPECDARNRRVEIIVTRRAGA